MVQNNKELHQEYSEVDNEVFSAFCRSFSGVDWTFDFKDNADKYCGIDAQITATTRTKKMTYDAEIKSVHLNKLLDYCFLQADKWLSLVEWDNQVKLYVAIYTHLNKIAIWRVDNDLLTRSEKALSPMKVNTCNGNATKEKTVYKLKLSDANVYYFDLTNYKGKFNALHNKRIQNN